MAATKRTVLGFKPMTAAAARRDANAELKRQQAVKAQATTLLNPDDVAGEWDAARTLMTTIGGAIRPLTREDLATFRENARRLKAKFKGGITAKQIVDLSWKDDRERAHKQIKTALPVSFENGVIHFQTNASEKSDKTHHQVFVHLLDFSAAVASPAPAEKIVGEVTGGKLRFDCDCGRHRFWFRYLATTGNYNFRVAESNFPKIRNPQLSGVACKHVLRVMAMLSQSPTMRQYLVGAINKARKTEEVKRADSRVKDMTALAENMAKESWRQRAVRTSAEKKRKPSEKAAEALKARALEKAKAKKINTALKTIENSLKAMLSLGAINQAQYDAKIAAMKKD